MSPTLRRLLAAFVLVVFAAVTAIAQSEARNSGEAGGASTTPTTTRNTPIDPKYTTPKSPNDTAYGAKIAEYTTEKYFLTELVDHLPASDKVPSPEKVLGYAVGTPNKLTYERSLSLLSRARCRVATRARPGCARE